MSVNGGSIRIVASGDNELDDMQFTIGHGLTLDTSSVGSKGPVAGVGPSRARDFSESATGAVRLGALAHI